MWILIVFMMVQTPGGLSMRAGALPGSYSTLEECQAAQRDLLQEAGEPDPGIGFGCVKAETGARNA